MRGYEIRCESKPICIELGIEVRKPCKIRIRAFNPSKIGCVFLDRVRNLKKSGVFEIRMPQSCEKVVIQVMGDTGVDGDVRITRLKKKELNQHFPCVSSGNKTSEFIEFAQHLSEDICTMKTGKYRSKTGKFKVELLDVIESKGRALETPARIHNSTGVIQISKKHFSSYTVPMRMSILLHEYSHFYLNVDYSDEIEADLNALKMYLGLGYPVIEAHKSFLNVFKRVPTPENRERYEYIKAFIDNFDDIKYRICLP